MKTSPREHALASAEMSREIAAAIDDAILAQLPDDADILTVYAQRIRTCGQTSNLWRATDLHTADGEAFDGAGRLWQCGSKLCPYCLQRRSQAVRKQLRQRIELQKLNVGEHWHFLTFTMPNQGLPILEARNLLNKSWALFRKKQWFKEKIIGGFKSEEFTVTRRGNHYHAHALVRSKYIEYESFRHYWTAALRFVFNDAGRDFTAATVDGMAIANCRRVGALSEVINEVAKYVTKSTSWKKLNPTDLLDVCRIERWPRMTEFFGSFRISDGVPVPEVEADVEEKTILDTKSLSDCDPGQKWRRDVRRMGVAEYLENFHETVTEQKIVRMAQLRYHFKAARFAWGPKEKTIDTDQIVDRLFKIYERAGRPPPESVYKHLDLHQRIDLYHTAGITLDH